MKPTDKDEIYKIQMDEILGVFGDSNIFTTTGTAVTLGHSNIAADFGFPRKIYLGMYVYVEKWPDVPVYEQSKYKVCVNSGCYLYLADPSRGKFSPSFSGEHCSNCNNPRRYYAVESVAPISMDMLNQPLGVKCFQQVWDKEAKDKKVIVPYPEYAFELGGTVIEDNLTPLKGIIDALKRSEKVHEYWYVLCASLQRYEAKFQPGRGLVIV